MVKKNWICKLGLLSYEKSRILYLMINRLEVNHMEATVKFSYSPEEQARQEIRSFVNEGLKDVGENAVYDFDEAFDALESRYKAEGV